jgi:hypothetical protein
MINKTADDGFSRDLIRSKQRNEELSFEKMKREIENEKMEWREWENEWKKERKKEEEVGK